MAVSHVNNNLEVGRCTAGPGNCPFKNNPHSENVAELYVFVEKELEKKNDVLVALSAKDKPKTFEDFYKSVVPLRLQEKGKEQEKLLETARRENRRLDVMEMEEHEAYVEEITSLLRDKGGETNVFLTDENGLYSDERVKKQQALLFEMYERFENVPAEKKALLGGGMGGAGKTSTLKKFKVVDPDDYVSINPDDFKEAMAESGMIPKIPGLLPMEASTLVHNEASELAVRLFGQSLADGKNVFLDQTLAKIDNTRLDLIACKKANYKIDGFFIDVSPAVSAERARYRYTEATNNFLEKGEGCGGRPIPSFFSKSQITNVPGSFNSVNAANFMELTKIPGLFRTPPRIFDNSVNGRIPEEIDINEFGK